MLGVLLSLAVAVSPGAAVAEPRPVPLPVDVSSGDLDAGAPYFSDERRGRSTVERFDLETGERTIVWAAADRRASIGGLETGGGRLAFELGRGLDRTRVLALDPLRRSPSLIDSGRSFQRDDCGRSVKLEHVSETGDIVVSSRPSAAGGAAASG